MSTELPDDYTGPADKLPCGCRTTAEHLRTCLERWRRSCCPTWSDRDHTQLCEWYGGR